MREILFRAKKKYGNGWCYGIPITEEHNTYKTGEFVMANAVNYDELDNFEASYYFVPIKKETIDQYTGLNDKNGNRIFEGDILQYGYKRLVVWWNGEAFQWQAKEKNTDYTHTFDGKNLDVAWDNIDLGWIACETACIGKITTQVIGNIIDNPELLKEGK